MAEDCKVRVPKEEDWALGWGVVRVWGSCDEVLEGNSPCCGKGASEVHSLCCGNAYYPTASPSPFSPTGLSGRQRVWEHPTVQLLHKEVPGLQSQV